MSISIMGVMLLGAEQLPWVFHLVGVKVEGFTAVWD